jgi:hypothetical protein
MGEAVMDSSARLHGDPSTSLPAVSDDRFRVWAFGDAHVGTDKWHGRESLADAMLAMPFRR